MAKKVVLTENKLRKIVSESIRMVLNEVSFQKMYGTYQKLKENGNKFYDMAKECWRNKDENGYNENMKKSEYYNNRAYKLEQTFKSMYNGEKDGIQQTFGVGNDDMFSVSSKTKGNDSFTGNRNTKRSLTQHGYGDNHRYDEYDYKDDYRTSKEQYQPKEGDVLAYNQHRTEWNDGTTLSRGNKYVVADRHDDKLRYNPNFWPYEDEEYNGEFETSEFDKLRQRRNDINQWIAGKKDSRDFRTDLK